ncbi:four helix bundle protein [Mariprofundus sp. EBB-1]|uniref:four helix bundle protein n=1 Tax=Mariprofundus sp. EBB-1 TaxID=2650971 RepID=UPI0035159C3D
MKSHKDLDVWKKAVDLSVNIYSVTEQFPRDEIYGMTSQMRRAAVSVASTIVQDAPLHAYSALKGECTRCGL